MKNNKRLMDKIITEPMTMEHLSDIGELHYKILYWSVNGKLGKEHIYKLYNALFQCDSFFGYVYYFQGRLIGFTTATTDFREVRKAIEQVYEKKIMEIIIRYLFQPRYLIGFFESKFIVPLVYKKYNVKAEWLTLVTDLSKPFLNSLVASKLISNIYDHFKKLGMTYMAQAVKNNPKAINYYNKLHWKRVCTLFIHNIYIFK